MFQPLERFSRESSVKQVTRSGALWVLLISGVMPGICRAQEPHQDIAVDNRTQSLAVDSITVSYHAGGPSVRFTVTNRGNKLILGYEVRVGNDVRVLQEFIPPRNPGLQIGASDQRTLTASDPTTNLSNATFHVLAVLFADASAEGDPENIDDLRMLRDGRRMAEHRMQPLLDGLAQAIQSQGGQEPSVALSHVLEQLKQISPQNSAGQPLTGLVASGFQDALESTIYELNSIIDNHLQGASISAAILAIVHTRTATRDALDNFAQISSTQQVTH